MKPQLEQLEDRLVPSNVYTVTTLADIGPGSLTDAITQVNRDKGTGIDDTINFAVNGTILLTQDLLGVQHHVTVMGPGSSLLTIDGQGHNGWFVYPPDDSSPPFGFASETQYVSELCGMTMQNCVGGTGPAVFARESMCLEDMCFDHNTATGGASGNSGGAAVLAGLTAMVDHCMFENNSGNGGGALYCVAKSLAISNSEFLNNAARGFGGGLRSYATTVSLTNTSFVGNTAGGHGSSFYLTGTVTPDLTGTVWDGTAIDSLTGYPEHLIPKP